LKNKEKREKKRKEEKREMDDYRKNIFFFWDHDIPQVYADHVESFQNRFPNYHVHLINDAWAEQYLCSSEDEKNKSFWEIYRRIKMGAAKADFIRLLLMYLYGGLYLDIMCETNEHFKDMDELFSRLDKKSVYLGCMGNDFCFGVMLARPKTLLFQSLYETSRENLTQHYHLEKTSFPIKPEYNIFMLTGPRLFNQVVFGNAYQCCSKYLTIEENYLPNLPYLEKWDCDFVPIDDYFLCWHIGYDHHHGKNMDKHWSIRQTKETLFEISQV
jgi:hypothetical protein